MSADEIIDEVLEELKILEDYKVELAIRDENFGNISREVNESDYSVLACNDCISVTFNGHSDEDYSDTFGHDPTTENYAEITTMYFDQNLSNISIMEASYTEKTSRKLHISTITFITMLSLFVIMFVVMIICIRLLPPTDPNQEEII